MASVCMYIHPMSVCEGNRLYKHKGKYNITPRTADAKKISENSEKITKADIWKLGTTDNGGQLRWQGTTKIA